jgi:hypothetical protein
MKTQANKAHNNQRITLKERNSNDPLILKLAEYMQQKLGGEIVSVTGKVNSENIRICLMRIKPENYKLDMLELLVGEACKQAGAIPTDEPLTFIYCGVKRYFTNDIYESNFVKIRGERA